MQKESDEDVYDEEIEYEEGDEEINSNELSLSDEEEPENKSKELNSSSTNPPNSVNSNKIMQTMPQANTSDVTKASRGSSFQSSEDPMDTSSSTSKQNSQSIFELNHPEVPHSNNNVPLAKMREILQEASSSYEDVASELVPGNKTHFLNLY